MTLLAAAGVSKSFPGVRALERVDFDLGAGEIHALVGENGAGKSTLIKIMGGAVVPDAGAVALDGVPLPAGDPLRTRRRGLDIVYQELTLVPEMTAAENIFLGRERGWPLLRRREMARSAREILEGLGARVDAGVPVRALGVAQRQMVEIARALSSRSKVLVLDEPTATLTGAEAERLFAALRGLRSRGLGIVYISHRLEEVFAIADRVTVLRDGRRVASAPVGGLDRARLIRWMVGRDVSEEFPPRAGVSGDPATRAAPADSATRAASPADPVTRAVPPADSVLEVRHLACPPHFRDVSFAIRPGEIVGLAGLLGAGRTAVALALFGALRPEGDLLVAGRPARFRSPSEALDAGLAYVTEDRKRNGLFPLLGAGANMTIVDLRAFARRGLLSVAREEGAARAAARDFGVRCADLHQPAGTLSGGNQQKLLLARYLLSPRRLLVLDEPTRGLDVVARAEIYALMNRLTAGGLAILLISSDLPEVLGMSDRVVVMHEGRTTGEIPRGRATPEGVMALATGGR